MRTNGLNPLRYPVSQYYKEFLDMIYNEPLFEIEAINPALFTKKTDLKQIKALRQMLFYMKDFVMSCRHRDTLMDKAKHLLPDRTHLIFQRAYSINDLVLINKDLLLEPLLLITKLWMHHILHCDVST